MVAVCCTEPVGVIGQGLWSVFEAATAADEASLRKGQWLAKAIGSERAGTVEHEVLMLDISEAIVSSETRKPHGFLPGRYPNWLRVAQQWTSRCSTPQSSSEFCSARTSGKKSVLSRGTVEDVSTFRTVRTEPPSWAKGDHPLKAKSLHPCRPCPSQFGKSSPCPVHQ